jgi:hypothetical protein
MKEDPALIIIGETKEEESRSSSKARKKLPPPKNLSGATLVEYKCRKRKKAWTRCVSGWYDNRFLEGKAVEPEGDCDDLFDSFRQCYMRGMLKVHQKKNSDAPSEGTMLAEFVEEEGIEPEKK